jgi:glycosyltransferase involved in cell wall biosynthesis
VTSVHVVVPEGIDDPARPSGGNVYDRHVCRGLESIGWSVHEHTAPAALERIPDDAVVLVDGLVASEELVPHARRLRLVVLVHMPLGDRGEGEVLSAAAAVVTTSAWSRRRLMELHGLPAGHVHVAEPGVDAAGLAPGTAAGGQLLCVAAVIPGKGHDVLADALAAMRELRWHCVCVGSLERDAGFAERVRRRGLADFPGPRTGAELDRSYAGADLLVLPSRAEAYGMVVTEALARGLPVVASDVGGVPEALGDGGLLVPPDDPEALAGALRAWLADAELRARLREAARARSAALPRWEATTSVIAGVLSR